MNERDELAGDVPETDAAKFEKLADPVAIEWELRPNSGCHVWRSGADYLMVYRFGRGFTWVIGNTLIGGCEKTLEAAKAAAERAYNERCKPCHAGG